MADPPDPPTDVPAGTPGPLPYLLQPDQSVQLPAGLSVNPLPPVLRQPSTGNALPPQFIVPGAPPDWYRTHPYPPPPPPGYPDRPDGWTGGPNNQPYWVVPSSWRPGGAPQVGPPPGTLPEYRQALPPDTPPIQRSLIQNEKGSQHAINPINTSSGHAQSWFQITTGTWQEFAPRAGVDLNRYPTPESAPFNVQQQVAQNIPLRRWSTFPQLQQQYPGLNGNMTLGEATQYYNGNQRLMPPVSRQPSEWGKPPNMNGPPGTMPLLTDIPNIMGMAQRLAGISSLGGANALAIMLTAYGAMVNARNRGQLLEQQYQDNLWKSALAEHNARAEMELGDLGQALAEFGTVDEKGQYTPTNGDTQALTDRIRGLAFQYSDPQLKQLVDNGDFTGIQRLATTRDMLGQGGLKLQKQIDDHNAALQKQHDDLVKHQRIEDATKALDAQSGITDPANMTPEQTIAHAENIGRATRMVLGGVDPTQPKPSSREARPGPYSVTDDKGNTTQQELIPQPGGGFNYAQGNQPVPSNYQVTPPVRAGARSGPDATGTEDPYDIYDKDGRRIETRDLRPYLNRPHIAGQPQYFDPSTGRDYEPPAGGHVQRTRGGQAGGGINERMNERIINAGKQVQLHLSRAMKLSKGTTIGMFGDLEAGIDMSRATAGTLGRQLSSEEQIAMQQTYSELRQEVAQAVMMGLRGSNQTAEAVSSLVPRPGMTIANVMTGFAMTKEAVIAALTTAQNNPGIGKRESDEISQIIDSLNKAVPWSSESIIGMMRQGNTTETYEEYAKRIGLIPGGGSATPSAAQGGGGSNPPSKVLRFDSNGNPIP